MPFVFYQAVLSWSSVHIYLFVFRFMGVILYLFPFCFMYSQPSWCIRHFQSIGLMLKSINMRWILRFKWKVAQGRCPPSESALKPRFSREHLR